ncbi:MAG: hypothetical protein V9G24_15340 [Rhodoblastus sp.]
MKLILKKGKPAFPPPTENLRKHAEEYGFANFIHRFGRDPSDLSEPDTAAYKAASEALSRKSTARIMALATHYGAPTDDLNKLFTWLFLTVAKDFIPNFDVYKRPPKKGRPAKRGEKFGLAFLVAVTAKAEERKRGISDACLQLTKKERSGTGQRRPLW